MKNPGQDGFGAGSFALPMIETAGQIVDGTTGVEVVGKSRSFFQKPDGTTQIPIE